MPEGRYFVGGILWPGRRPAWMRHFRSVCRRDVCCDPNGGTDLQAMGKLVAFAEAVGANVEIMSHDEHDMAAAIISHLPHVMSGALLGVAEEAQRQSGKVFGMAAGSFRDLTRISGSSPELWRDICLTNRMPLLRAIGGFQGALADFKRALMTGDEEAVTRFFEQAGQIRKTYLRIVKE